MNTSTFSTDRSAALVLRLGLGTLALAHGMLKIFVFTPAGTVGFFASLGLPAFMAYATIGVEVLAGLALIAGVWTRLASVAMIPILLGSIVFAHWQAGWLFSNAGGGWEFPALWTLALVVQALLGDGAYALKLGRRAATTTGPAIQA